MEEVAARNGGTLKIEKDEDSFRVEIRLRGGERIPESRALNFVKDARVLREYDKIESSK